MTQIIRYTNANAGTGAIPRAFNYDTLGNLRSAELDCCNLQTWDYASAYQYAYPTTVSRGGLATNYTYNFDSGTTATVRDENEQTTTYTYDLNDRLRTVEQPNGVVSTTAYVDNSSEPELSRSNSANSAVQWAQFDGSGKQIRSELREGASTVSAVQTEYDNAGRLYRRSNPFAPGDPVLWTTYEEYDPLGRVKRIEMPDGSESLYEYTGNATVATDPAGKQRRTLADALGRLSKVEEPGWGDALPGKGSVTISGTLRTQEECYLGDCYMNYDSGIVAITANGHTTTYNYDGYVDFPSPPTLTPTTLAPLLASAINNDALASVNAVASGATINLTARTTGHNTNYSLAAYSSSNRPDLFGTRGSFGLTPSGPTLSPGQDAAANQSMADVNTPLTTTYQYDPLDNVTSVVQGYLASVSGQPLAGQTRSFTYDSMGRMLTSQTPESGLVRFTYESFGAVETRTDARGVITTYSYDDLYRLTQISYNVGRTGVPATSTVNRTYGNSAAQFNKGRLLSVSNGTASETYSYNNMGEVTGVSKMIEGTSYPLTYGRNSLGQLTSLTYPTARVVSQTYNTLGRLNQISSGGTNLLSIAPNDYNAAGQVLHTTYGNGVVGDYGYNERLQIAAIRYHGTSAQDLLNLAYSYTSTPGAADNNGQIQSVKYYTQPGVEDTTKSENFEYDAWLRLKRSYTTSLATSSPSTFRLEWTYDRFGNRLTQTGTGGGASVTQPQLAVSEATNCISTTGFACDANGNLRQDPLHTYTYDAENQLVALDGTNTAYGYDGNGLRVTKTTGTNKITYVFSSTKVIAEYVGVQTKTLSREYVYVGSRLLVTMSGGATTYSHPDHLSTRAESNVAGGSTRAYGHFPFGETWYETGTASKWKFTTYEREDETRPDYATFRYYSSRWGRFIQADPLSGTFTYAFNDPLNSIDTLGLFSCPIFREGEPPIPCPPGGDDLPRGRTPMQPPPTDGNGGGGALPKKTDALCTFIIKIKNTAGVGEEQLAEIKAQIDALFGDSIGVDFVSTGKSDYTLRFSNAGSNNLDYGLQVNFLFWRLSPSVFVNNIARDGASLRWPSNTTTRVMGTVGAHELVHRIIGTGDLPYDPNNPADLMSVSNNPNGGSLLENNGLQLAPSQLGKLLEDCLKKHPAKQQ